DKDPVAARDATAFSADQSASVGAAHVRWDIVSLNVLTTPPTVSAGGVAFASARNPSTLKIRLTGSGTLAAPASGGPPGAVTGGGTWETFRSEERRVGKECREWWVGGTDNREEA